MPRDLTEYPEVQTTDLDEDGKVLLRAADRILEKGWYFASAGGYQKDHACMMSAIHDEGGQDLHAFARRLGFPNSGMAIDWNDEPGRTKAEVLARLRSAAHAVPR